MKTVRLSHIYEHTPRDVWRVATDLECLQEAVRGLLSFEGMPKGVIHQGQVVDVKVSMFGILPAQPYRMELIEFDDAEMRFKSNEVGMGVEHWQHSLRIVPHAQGAELHDEIEIEAGWRTPLIAVWARFMYKRRHKPRQKMLLRHSGSAG
ncbi:polyketide cyclase/dehydrase/lipid transport protein [Planktotalea frisia]|jgi:ligand-binding SRPBCC domain-containing protein|uniref:Polyketide cyclase / dehydrase and lipid transport n=1 Tax=Planktotalea frisia TaxID=696762 RepID=A0A1L9NY43_9RHOB|nr:SRPBCC family protein [Planktotalea frisia]OJI94218.1 polyketide cyclase / dehydrase and lipid transport [Planktotalea frisia]PZX29698.1 polyketide cyclase/dehydrase/lipid transport protein [Planktotalea frisia]